MTETSKHHSVHRLISTGSFDEMLRAYSGSSAIYDEDFSDDVYKAPGLVVKALEGLYYQDGPTPRHQLRIMDIAAGTGLVGQKAFDVGFTNMDALDPSPDMLALLLQKGLYQNIVQDTIGDHQIDVDDDTYDAVTVAGGFAPEHCPVTAFDEMLRICKPGGYVINAMRLEYLFTVPEYDQLENHLKSLEKAGKWRRISREIIDRYFCAQKQGLLHVYQKL